MNIGEIIGKVVGSSAGTLIKDVGDTVGQFIQTKDEKAAAELALTKVINDHLDKIQEQTTDALKSEDIAITDRWKADMVSDSWLSKNTRPMVLLALFLFLFIAITADSIPALHFTVKSDWVNLLGTLLVTVVVAYYGSRGVEKWQTIKNAK